MKHLSLSAIALFTALGSVAKVHAETKIAVVDLQRAIVETEDGRKAKARLKKLFDNRQSKLEKRQNDLKGMKTTIEKQKNVLSKSALRKKMEDYQKSFTELQTTYVDYQRELAKKEHELTKSIISKMEEILRRIGQEKGYDLIVERNESGVVWVPSSLDLTDIVIQKYNAGARSKKK